MANCLKSFAWPWDNVLLKASKHSPSALKTHHVYYKPSPAVPTAQQWQSLNGCNCSGLTGVRGRGHIRECRAGL